MDDSTGLTQYVYDSEGHLLNKVYPDGKSIAYQYDKQGNKKEIITPFNKKIVYQYNELNQLKQLGVDDKVGLVTYDYLANGQLKNKTQANGVISSYIFDHSNLTEVKRLSSLGEDKENYGYDLNKNIERISTSKELNQYTYDTLNRIETTTQGNQLYEYDENGNRELLNSDIVPILENKTYEYDTNNRLIKVVDDDNQITYRYNGDGLLYEKEIDNQITRYYYDGDVLLAEAEVENGQSNLRNHYVTGNDKELLINESQQLYYFVTDGLENVIELRDTDGNTVNKYRYDMWGNPVETDENVENPLHYSGELWEETTGLQYLRSRWYDPSLGRFLNEDSFEGELKNPLSLNQYTYVENNSLINYDPNGTFSIKKNSLQGNQGSHGIGKYSKVSVSPGKTPKGVGDALKSIKGLDDLLNDPSKLKGVKPDELIKYLKDKGYNPQPLSGGSLKGKSCENGGGFKVNWGGDRILQYHPGSRHHGGVPYWKFSSGKTGTNRYDMLGNLID